MSRELLPPLRCRLVWPFARHRWGVWKRFGITYNHRRCIDCGKEQIK